MSGAKRQRHSAGCGDDLHVTADEASPFFVLRVRRDHIVDDSLEVISKSSVAEILKPVKVVFEGEPCS